MPDSIKAEATFELFKVSLSKFLALIPDNPPISGYSCMQLVQFPGRLFANEVVRHLMTLPATRINSTKVSKKNKIEKIFSANNEQGSINREKK